MVGIAVGRGGELQNVASKTADEVGNDWDLKPASRHDHIPCLDPVTFLEGDFKCAVIQLNQASDEMPKANRQAEACRIGLEIFGKLIAVRIKFTVTDEFEPGKRAELARGEQGQRVVSSSPAIPNAASGIDDDKRRAGLPKVKTGSEPCLSSANDQNRLLHQPATTTSAPTGTRS